MHLIYRFVGLVSTIMEQLNGLLIADCATIRSFVLKFTELGLLEVRKYGNRNKYFVV